MSPTSRLDLWVPSVGNKGRNSTESNGCGWADGKIGFIHNHKRHPNFSLQSQKTVTLIIFPAVVSKTQTESEKIQIGRRGVKAAPTLINFLGTSRTL